MAGQLTIDTLKASSGVLATQNGMTGIAKSWALFSTTGGVLTVTKSFNVSSITRTGTGQFTYNFSTSMPDSNYVVAGTGSSSGAAQIIFIPFANGSGTTTAPSTSAFTGVFCYTTSSGATSDVTYGMVVVFN